jgi:hypothetical protein
MESVQCESKMPHRYDNNVNPDNHGDSSDGSRDSAMDLSDNKPMVVTATNLQEITSKLLEKVQALPQEPSQLSRLQSLE